MPHNYIHKYWIPTWIINAPGKRLNPKNITTSVLFLISMVDWRPFFRHFVEEYSSKDKATGEKNQRKKETIQKRSFEINNIHQGQECGRRSLPSMFVLNQEY